MASVTLELHVDRAWHPAAHLDIPFPERGADGPCTLRYHEAWVDRCLGRGLGLDARGPEAVSVSCPVSYAPVSFPRWPAWLDDLRPGGAARRWWVGELGLAGLSPGQQDWELLSRGCVAPIGNMRVAESQPNAPYPQTLFEKDALVERATSFLDEAARRSMAVGGASGAGGDATKFLIRRTDDDRLWVDGQQNDELPDRHWLVKFARGSRTPDDCDIVRTEAAYARVLSRLGFETVADTGLELCEARRAEVGPSLWMPRFDVRPAPGGGWERLAVESYYALCDVGPGQMMSWFTVLDRLLPCVNPVDPAALVADVIVRDFVNWLLGNTDNHGRNGAILRTPEGPRLAPIYDLAPMAMDPDLIKRMTRWRDPDSGDPRLELAGEIAWHEVISTCALRYRGEGVRADALWSHWKFWLGRLSGLPDLLRDAELPARAWSHPLMRLRQVEERIARWSTPP